MAIGGISIDHRSTVECSQIIEKLRGMRKNMDDIKRGANSGSDQEARRRDFCAHSRSSLRCVNVASDSILRKGSPENSRIYNVGVPHLKYCL